MNELVKDKQKWELLYEAVVKLQYGTTLLHTEIVDIIDEPYKTEKYFSIVGKAKKELLKAGKMIESLHGQGYRVVQPADYVGMSAKTFKQGLTNLKQAKTTLECTPVNHLTLGEAKIHRDVSDRVTSLYAHMEGAKTELRLLTKKTSNTDKVPTTLAR